MTLGGLVQKYMDENKITNAEFARRSGITKAYVPILISGINPKTGKPIEPSISTYVKIANVLGMPVDTLMHSVDDSLVRIGDEKEEIESASTPNHEAAAAAAMDLLIRHHVTSFPVLPLPILTQMPNTLVLSFTEMADDTGIDRDTLVCMFGSHNQDAVTIIKNVGDVPLYCIAYNQRLPFYMIQHALARELGHIVLEHDFTKLDDVSVTEALYFARYLLCPRPLIALLKESKIPLNVETVGNITGCYGRFLAGIRRTPGAHISAELNARVKAQFADYVQRFIEYQAAMAYKDASLPARFGSFMDNYI